MLKAQPGPTNLRLAAHLGIRSTKAPLFAALVGTLDPPSQIRFIAAQGFSAVSDNRLPTRSLAEQKQVGNVDGYRNPRLTGEGFRKVWFERRRSGQGSSEVGA